MKPRIAIPVPTSTDHAYNRLNWSSYADAVLAAGAEPVEFALTLSSAEAARLAATCQAILLPGSPADVAPAKYGQAAEETCAPSDPAREELDQLLLEDAYRHRKPILAICFGLQFLNTWRGGTLVQDLSVMPVNHSAGRSVAVAHTVSVAPASMLELLAHPEETRAVGDALRLPVNSSHHQAVGLPGDSLVVSSRCPQDGVIESIEGVNLLGSPPHFVLGFQWHPERTVDTSATSRVIFSRFGREAAAWTSADAAAAAV
jgi:putative glutamine amidotransferase